MRRGLLIVLGTVTGLAGLLALGWWLLRRGEESELPDEVQWPFDRTELRTLMDQVIADQREAIEKITDAAERVRAESFLKYYEDRRAAV